MLKIELKCVKKRISVNGKVVAGGLYAELSLM